MVQRRRGLYWATLEGLGAPRRALPIGLVSATLILSQMQLTPHPASGPLAASMCALFLLTAPYSWRLLNPAGHGLVRGALRVGVYAALGIAVAYVITVPLPRWLGLGPTLLASDTTWYISLALFWVGGWGLGRDLDFEEHLRRERERAEAMEREAERARLLALKSHLDPHFLFNTLNAIAEWCRRDGEVAERAILKLSSMLRTVLSGVPLTAWSLERELELCAELLELHLIRDPEMFRVQRSIAVDTYAHRVPPLILLPLFENAVKHGPAAGKRGALSLSIHEGAGRLRILLENPGEFRGLRDGGSGFLMVERRLELAYSGAASVQIQGHEGRTRVTLNLPTGYDPGTHT
ncbi:MAG TPA: histidine kinase [Polyangiaceae bacterium]